MGWLKLQSGKGHLPITEHHFGIKKEKKNLNLPFHFKDELTQSPKT